MGLAWWRFWSVVFHCCEIGKPSQILHLNFCFIYWRFVVNLSWSTCLWLLFNLSVRICVSPTSKNLKKLKKCFCAQILLFKTAEIYFKHMIWCSRPLLFSSAISSKLEVYVLGLILSRHYFTLLLVKCILTFERMGKIFQTYFNYTSAAKIFFHLIHLSRVFYESPHTTCCTN